MSWRAGVWPARGTMLIVVFALALAEPRVVVESWEEHRLYTKRQRTTVHLVLDNPGETPVWFVLGRFGGLNETNVRLRPSPSGVGRCGEGCFEVGGWVFVRVPPGDVRTATEETSEELGVAVATVTADGEPLDRARRWTVRGPCDPGNPRGRTEAECHADLLEAWDARIRDLRFAWASRWLVSARGEVEPWQAPPPAEPPKPHGEWAWFPLEDRANLESLPTDQLVAWLDAAWFPVLASADARVWERRGNFVLLEGERRTVRLGGALWPVDPQHRTVADEGEFWIWDQSFTLGDTWTPAGPGYVTTPGTGLVRVGEAEPGAHSKGLYPPLTFQSTVARGAVRVSGAPAVELVEALLNDPVWPCYDDARFGDARAGMRSMADLLYGPPVELEPGTNLYFGGHIQVVAEVAADGHATRARVDGPSTPRFSACIARNVPKAWWLAPAPDGLPYTVSVAYTLTPER